MLSDVEIFLQLENHAGLVSIRMGRLKVVWFFICSLGHGGCANLRLAVVA
jgi:hypothetical protein